MDVDGFALGTAHSASYEVSDPHLEPGGVLVAYADSLLSSLWSSTCTNVRYAQHAAPLRGMWLSTLWTSRSDTRAADLRATSRCWC